MSRNYAVYNKELTASSLLGVDYNTAVRYCHNGYVVATLKDKKLGYDVRFTWSKYNTWELKWKWSTKQIGIWRLHISISPIYIQVADKIVYENKEEQK